MNTEKKEEPKLSSEEIHQKIDEIINYVNESYPGRRDLACMQLLLQDRGCLFYHTKMVFDADPLNSDEFAFMHQVDQDKTKGFMLYMHPFFKERADDLPFLMAYHFGIVNFGYHIEAEHAEKFGAGLNRVSVDDYYDKLNVLFEEMIKT